MQLSNVMRLVFDKRIGDNTARLLRAQVIGRGTGAVAGARAGSGARLVAALVGGALGAAALVVAAPSLRGSKAPMAPGAPRPTAAVAQASAEPTEAPASQPTAEPPTPAPAATQAPSAPREPEARAADRVAAETAIERANAAMAEGRPGEAVAAYEQAFAAVPSLRPSHVVAYAKALTEDGKTRFDADADAAMGRFKAAIAADPGAFDAHFFLAKIFTRKSDPESAQREYKEAIRINPKSADAQFNLGFVYFVQKRYDEARAQYEKVVELKPPYLADVFYNLAACYEQMKRKPEAIETLRRGLRAVPDSDSLKQRLKQLGG